MQMLDEDQGQLTPQSMIHAIRNLPFQKLPSQSYIPGLLDGLDVVVDRARALMATKPTVPAAE